MFWKKKKPDDTAIFTAQDNQRQAFRYTFRENDALTVQFKDQSVGLINISATGLCFRNRNFSENDTDLIEFELDIPNYIGNTTVAVWVRILEIDENNVCRCMFQDCSDAQQNLIHKYLLEKQKTDLRTRKRS